MRTLLCLAAVLVFSATTATAAQPPLWAVDPPHCSVNFRIKHIFAQIPGHFERFDGVVRFDPDNLAASSISMTVDVASINTAVAKRDQHLRSPDFFDAKKYPALTFTSDAITRKDDKTFLAKGKLTVKDVTREVELPFTFFGTVESPLEKGKTVAGFECLFPVKLADFHVGDDKWQKMGVIGDTAAVAVYLELLRQ
jgi:polyisoprenoid-binding protein YceI